MLTWPEMARVVEELRPRVEGGQIQKVRQPDNETLCLTVRTPGRTSHIILSVSPGGERISEAECQTTTLATPTALGAWVRRHARGRRISTLSLRPDDRVLDLHVSGGRVILELFSRAANIYAVDSENRVVASARKPRGDLQLGAPYIPAPPPAQGFADLTARFETAVEVEGYFSVRLQDTEAQARVRERTRLVTRARKRLGRLEERVHQDITRCTGADSLRKMGELLKGQLHLVEPKATEVVLDDWFDASVPKLTIPLDPRLDGPGNVERIFHRYRRARDGADRARERQEEIQRLRVRFDELIGGEPGIDELRSRLIALGLVQVQSGPGRRSTTVRKPFIEFTSAKGERILVGRGGRDNHETTFHHARGNDHWLHARDCPGAHVIVPCPRRDQDPHPETLLDAAALAVHHSKMRGEVVVPVSHTLRKHLRPIKGGAPGQVTVAGAKTITITDVTTRITRLYARPSTS